MNIYSIYSSYPIIVILVLSISFSCSNEIEKRNLNITFDKNALKIPVNSDVEIMKIYLQKIDDVIIYNDGFTLYLYNPTNESMTTDTLLSNYDYMLPGYFSLFGTLDSNLILTEGSDVYIYHIANHSIKKIDDVVRSYLPDTFPKYSLRLSGNSFGRANRPLVNFLPFSDIRYYSPDRPETYFYFLHNSNVIPIRNTIPIHFLDLLFRWQPNMLFPMIEQDLSGDGINVNFKLSCKVFNVQQSGKITELQISDPDCNCGLNKENFLSSKAEQNYLPNSLAKYGNLYPDKYNNLYYQFIQSEVKKSTNQRNNYLRVLDSDYNILAKIKINWDEYVGRLMLFNGAAYIQSNLPPDEENIYFHKIKLVEES